MKSKWRIKGIEGYVFSEDGRLYRLPYEKEKRTYGIREVIIQDKKRYRINGKWWSQKQLKHLLYLDPDPIILFEESILPF